MPPPNTPHRLPQQPPTTARQNPHNNPATAPSGSNAPTEMRQETDERERLARILGDYDLLTRWSAHYGEVCLFLFFIFLLASALVLRVFFNLRERLLVVGEEA